MPHPTPLVSAEWFWARVDRTAGVEECWPWVGHLDRDGYGEVQRKVNGKLLCCRAHRFAYELLVGPIPEGLVIDHLCHGADIFCRGGIACLHRRCANPAHMEPVTNTENVRRGMIGQGVTGWAWRSFKTHCKHGHEFTPENTYLRQGKWRCCRRCAQRRSEASHGRTPLKT